MKGERLIIMKTIIRRLRLRQGLSCLVVGLLFAVTAAAQTISGSIGGIVKDSSGAVVPGVKVTVTDKSTGLDVSTMTNGVGGYQMPFLNSSTYRVTFTKDGFKTNVEDDVLVTLNQAVRVDATLTVGNITQSVQVTAQAPLINQESGVIGQSVSNADLIKYPENIGSHGPTN